MILHIILIYKLLQTNKTFFRGLKLSKLAKNASFDNLIPSENEKVRPGAALSVLSQFHQSYLSLE